VRSDGVVVSAPLLDQHLRLLEGIEDLAIQHLVTELAVELLVVAVLPRRSRLDIERRHPTRGSHSLTAAAVNSLPLSDRR